MGHKIFLDSIYQSMQDSAEPLTTLFLSLPNFTG
jgi:hypothetical protein